MNPSFQHNIVKEMGILPRQIFKHHAASCLISYHVVKTFSAESSLILVHAHATGKLNEGIITLS